MQHKNFKWNFAILVKFLGETIWILIFYLKIEKLIILVGIYLAQNVNL